MDDEPDRTIISAAGRRIGMTHWSWITICSLGATLAACGVTTAPVYKSKHDDHASANIPATEDSSGATGPNASVAGTSGQPPTALGTSTPDSGTAPSNRGSENDEPDVIDDTLTNTPAGLSEADVKALMAGGPRGSLKWLYPYDGTVFPRGVDAPIMMWEGAAMTDAVYLHIQSQRFEYKGILKPAAGQGLFHLPDPANITATALGSKQLQKTVQLDRSYWDRAGIKSRGASDPFTVELTARINGVVAGPVSLRFTIARGVILGAVYYNTFDQLNVDPTDPIQSTTQVLSGGKVMRVPLRGTAEVFTRANDGCYGCHCVSADGSRAIAQLVPGGVTAPPYTGSAVSYRVSASAANNPDTSAVGPRGAFAALYPDGSKFLATSLLTDVGGQLLYEAVDAPKDARLYDATTGTLIADTGIPAGALMPSFSPDGTRLVFNDFNINGAHGLAMMSYDTHTDKATNYVPLTQTDAAGAMRPSFPALLPDNQAVVYARTAGGDFTPGRIADTLVSADPDQNLPASDLYIVDVQSQTDTLLARAMGFRTASDATLGATATYLPYGAQDLHSNNQPTVLPVALGGYFWVFFDSWRNFGNLGRQRQLWVAAIDVRPDGDYTTDPSHPAFYLPGQGFGASNHRAFAALAACSKNSVTCASGIECCDGYCQASLCVEHPRTVCAEREERCARKADCCSPDDVCINGFCSLVELL